MNSNYDLALVVGLIVGVFAIPAIISAMADRRPPRVASVTLLVAGVLVAWAVMKKPGGYTLTDIPHVIVSVIGRLVNGV